MTSPKLNFEMKNTDIEGGNFVVARRALEEGKRGYSEGAASRILDMR